MRIPHRHASKRSRLGIEALEDRRLLTAAVLESDAVRALESAVRERIGISGPALDDVLGRRALEAPASGSADSAPFVKPLTLRDARAIQPAVSAIDFSAMRLDENAIGASLRSAPREAIARGVALADLPVLSLPTPKGGIARFAMEGYDLLAPQVAAQFPSIRSVRLVGLDDTFATGVATITELGLSASVLSPKGNWSIAPLSGDSADNAYASYFDSLQVSRVTNPDGTSVLQSGSACVCCTSALHSVMNDATNGGLSHVQALNSGPEGVDALVNRGPVRKTYRFAFSTTAEFTALYGSQALAFAGLTASVANMNAVYTRDLSINFQIVSDTRTVYTNSSTDPFNNGGTQSSMYEANQVMLDNTYTFAGYDVGHVFAQASGMSGVAVTFTVGAGSLGQTFKAKAVTQGTPAAANFMHVFMHEVGHQVGGEHIFNYLTTPPNANRDAAAAMEPGPGSSIMSYGGIGFTGDFVTGGELYFNVKNIDGIETYLTNNAIAAAAGTVTNTGNVAPEVTAPPDRTIPANTPFELTGQAWDTAGQSLTYTWEQQDLGDEDTVGVDDGNGPLFRSRLGTADTTRTFPELSDILTNTNSPEEMLPVFSRSADPLTFRVTVRDQLGGVSDDVVELPVVNTGSAFQITSQNSVVENWSAGSTQTITWNVAGTTGNGINTASVDIFISYDGGTTFTPMFFNATNDGSQQVTVPDDAPVTGNARVKVKGRGNYFFDINNLPIFITGNPALNGLPATAPAAELPLYGNIAGWVLDGDQPLMGAATSIDFAGDTDTYVISPPVTAGYIIETGRTGGSNVDTVLSVYDDLTGVQLAINDDYQGSTLTSRVVVGLEAGKKYRVSVGAYNSATTGDVFLKIQGTELTPTSTAITLNAAGDGSTTGNLASSRAANFHPFVIPSLYDGTGTITLSAPTAQSVFSLYDASNNLVALSTNGTITALGSFTPGQTYTLRVGTQNYASGGGAYTISINLGIDMPLPATLTTAEGTIAIHAPTRNSVDAHSPNYLIVSPDEVDALYFAPVATGQAARGGDIEVVGSAGLNPIVGLYNASTGARVALATGTGAGSTALIDNFGFQPGVRYIIAISGLGNTTGDPNVRVLMESGTPLPQTDVTLNAAGDGTSPFNFVSNSLGQSYRIVAPIDATGFVRFEADPDAASDVDLYLFNSTGNLLASSRAAGPDGAEAVAQLFVPPGTIFYVTVMAHNYAGGSTARTGVFKVEFDTPAAPPAPPAPVLLNTDDTGVSNSDGVTRNSNNLGLVVNAPTGQFVRLFRNGVQVAGPTTVGATAFLVLNDPSALSDGTYTYTATTALTASSPQSPASAGAAVTVDSLSPAFVQFVFNFENPTDQVFFVDFNDFLYGLTDTDIVVANLTTSQVIPTGDFDLVQNSIGPGSNDYSYNPSGNNDALPDGRYTLSLAAGAATDLAGNATAAVNQSFFFLRGDANRDARVNFDDLLILAANYNANGRTFTQGDFTADGVVNFDDLLILAAKYNYALPGSLAPAPVLAGPGPDDDARDDGASGAADVLA